MKNNLQFDFLVDKEKNTITIRREFLASRQLTWNVYTTSEKLDQWFAPKPMTTRTKSMDFSEGGFWLYAMIEPGGAEYWGRMDYLKIKPIENYTALDGFCDENGVLSEQFPRANWNVSFSDSGENAIVETIVTFNSLNDLETIIQMGMQEGLISTLSKLDELLVTLKNKPVK